MLLYERAKKLLHSEYQQNYKIIETNSYHRQYADEKLRHSLQVAGVGNGILRHEDYFQHLKKNKKKSCKFLLLQR